MWNTMECKRDNFNGSLGGASETRWECVSHCLKGVNRFKKGFFKMIFMIFFDNKGMNIIYLYFVKILYIYLRRNCEIFKFFFLRNMEDIGCCPSNVTIWSRYLRTFWKSQILSEINKVPNLASSHIWFLCEPDSTKKKTANSIFYGCVNRRHWFSGIFS